MVLSAWRPFARGADTPIGLLATASISGRPMNPYASFSPFARTVIVTAAICVIVIFVRSAASIVAPALLALFITVIAAPPLQWMSRKGVPKYLAVLIILLVLMDAGSLVALTTTGALEGLRENLPHYQERLTLLSEEFGSWLETIGIEKSDEAVRELLNPATASRFILTMLTNASGTVGTGFLVLLIVAFMLLETSALPAKLHTAFRLTKATEDQLQRLFSAINRYMLIKCLTSIATGICIWIWLYFLGIDYAVALAVAATLLNFLPIIGNILMTIPAAFMALVQNGTSTVIWVVLGYLIVNIVIGNIVEPRLMGRTLGISSLVVLLSLLFWGWVLGPIGLFLSVPLTIALMVALEASPQTHAIAIVLGSEKAQSERPDGRPGQKPDAISEEAMSSARADQPPG